VKHKIVHNGFLNRSEHGVLSEERGNLFPPHRGVIGSTERSTKEITPGLRAESELPIVVGELENEA
jgi:hypothetical protein